MAGKKVEAMMAQCVFDAIRNLREEEAQLEFEAFEEERNAEIAALAKEADRDGE